MSYSGKRAAIAFAVASAVLACPSGALAQADLAAPTSEAAGPGDAETKAANALQADRRFTDAEPLYRRALAARQKALGENSPKTADSYNNLALNLTAQNQHGEAERLLRRALELFRAVHGERHADTAAIYDNIGGSLAHQGRYPEAREAFRKALELNRAALGEDSLGTADSYDSLANILIYTGANAEAEPLARKALNIRRGKLGENHLAVADSYNSLAGIMEGFGRYREAEDLLRKALEIRRAALGEDHPKTGVAQRVLAGLLNQQGRSGEAEPVARRALDISRAASGEHSLETARSRAELANSLEGQGRFDQAEPHIRNALETTRTILGERHSQSAVYYSILGLNLHEQGRYGEAETLLRKALEIDTATLTEENGNVAATYNNLAMSLNGQGRFAEAEPLYRKALDIRRAVLGESHRETVRSYNNLAAVLVQMERLSDAELLFRKALATFRSTLGEDHPDTAAAYDNLAATIDKQRRYAEAEPLFRKSLDLRRAVIGENHPDTANSYNNLASCLTYQERYDEAVPLYRKALAIRIASLGENHPDTADTYGNIAETFDAKKDFAQGEPLFRKALAIKKATLGDDHIETGQRYEALAMNLAMQGRIVEAEQNGARALAIAIAAQPASGIASPDETGNAAEEGAFRRIYRGYLLRAAAAMSQAPAKTSVGNAILAAQMLLQTASSRAMIRAAAREAAGTGRLAQAVREEQDLRTEAQALDQRMIRALAGSHPEEADALRGKRSAIVARLAELDAQFDREFPSYQAIISPKPLPLERVQAVLKPDEGVLVLVATVGEVFSIAITSRNSTWRGLDLADAPIFEQIAHLRCQVDVQACDGQPSPDEAAPPGASHSAHFDVRAAHALYAALVEPVEGALAGVTRLYVTTSGQLGDLPIGALVTAPPPADARDDDPVTLARTAWLADRYAVSYLPALSGLLLREHNRPLGADDAPFSGYGDPDLAGDERAGCSRGVRAFAGATVRGIPVADGGMIRQLCPLPNTARELRSLARELKAPESVLNMRDRATESALNQDARLSRARVVAFSTHGTFAGEGAGLGFAEPGLIFTPPAQPLPLSNGTVDDGVLTASEASRLSLLADWVILSACNTASTQGTDGSDGLSALSRGFLYAGARSLLASHWRVADDSAAMLTVETMRLWRTGRGLTRAEALTEAMRAIRTGRRSNGTALPGHDPSMAHPADWAPFTVIANFDE